MYRQALMAALSMAAVLVVGCGSKSDQATVKDQSAQVQARGSDGDYPIDWCVVSGEKLGSMGVPVTRVYQGRTVKFCCSGCIRDFEAQPARYLARLDSAAAGMIRSSEGT